jgi:DegV family protein with EDD domain
VASMALGFIVLEGARAAKAGKSKEEVLEIINFYMEETRVLFMVDTLEYLQKNGRIGKAQAFLGGLLKMKPILSLKDGGIVPVEKARGAKKALATIVDLLKGMLPPGGKVKGAVVHGNALPVAEELAEELKKVYDISELIITPVGAVIGCHTGPGLLGLLFFPEKE